MIRCYLVRHAQTPWNRENRLQGRSDPPLSPLGQQQARCLGAFFASRRLTGLYTSGLQRSRQTAEAIVAGNGHAVRPVVEPRLAEIHLGTWEGLTPEEIDARFQGAYQQWRMQPSSVRIPEGEPLEAFRTRVRQALREIVARGGGAGECAIITHGGVIASLLADALQADYDLLLHRIRLDNAGITAFEFCTESPDVLWINGTAHLELAPPAADGRRSTGPTAEHLRLASCVKRKA